MVKSGLRICGCADVDIDKLELNCIFRLRVRVGVRVTVSISIYVIDVIKLQIGSVLTNNIRTSAVRVLPIAQNHGKDTASNHGPEDHYTVYKTQHLALTTIMTCSARFSSVIYINVVAAEIQR